MHSLCPIRSWYGLFEYWPHILLLRLWKPYHNRQYSQFCTEFYGRTGARPIVGPDVLNANFFDYFAVFQLHENSDVG